jgi:dCTP deaminase
VRIPPGAVGILALRSTYAREWLDHSAADFIQPGFQGTITYELRNNGPRPYSIRSGMRVMQIAFARTAAVPSKLYSGVYNGQQAELFARHQRGTP